MIQEEDSDSGSYSPVLRIRQVERRNDPGVDSGLLNIPESWREEDGPASH